MKRRSRLAPLVLGVWLVLSAPAFAAPLVSAVESVGMTVSDLDRSVAFFTDVLGFEKVSEVEIAGDDYEHLEGVFGLRMRVARLRLGDESLELTRYLAPRGRPVPIDSRSNDRWFQHVAIIVSDMDGAYRRLRDHHVEHASSGPQRLPETIPAAAGIRAFYFKDPDGHPLEILQFPPGKGAPKWHAAAAGKLFLGIDHTAIVVADTDASLRFYRDTLGLRVAGESENFGTEQEHLNGVFGARLRITALRAETGPGIELLEYLAPRDGRPAEHIRANDLAHWQTRLATHDAASAARAVRERRAPLVSAGVVATTGGELGFRRGFGVGDPDRHEIEIVER